MKRMLALGAGALMLGGCALPLPVQVASWALDGLSYIATQKSVTDHGISLLAEQDCAVLRGLVNDGEFCRDYDDAETAVADAGAASGLRPADREPAPETLTEIEALANFETAAGGAGLDGGALTNARPIIDEGPETASRPVSEPALSAADDPLAGYPTEIGGVDGTAAETAWLGDEGDTEDADVAAAAADFETAAGTAFPALPEIEVALPEIEVALASTAMIDADFALPPEAGAGAADWRARTSRPAADEAEPAAGLYFVIGSFREHANARKLRRRHRVLTPSVLAAKLERGVVFRVVVGPFDQHQAKRIHQRIYDAGISDSWAIQVRPGEWSMAVVDPPAEAPKMAALDPLEDGGWDPMRVIRMLASLIY